MKQKIAMIGFVLILASVLTGALSAVSAWTAPIIERNEKLKAKRSVLDALGIVHAGGDAEEVFDRNVATQERDGQLFYVSQDKDVAFKIEGNGLWGPIIGVIAVRSDLKTIKGITIIHQEETPGLGGRIGEQAYLASFRAKEIVPAITITAPGKAGKINEVDGITGATLSCKAFETILNSASGKYLPLIEGIER